MVGTQIGQYRLDALVQVDGTVSCYAATHVSLKRAVKIYIQHKESTPSLALRAQMLSRPGVQTTQLLDYFETDDYQVLVINEVVGLAKDTEPDEPEVKSNNHSGPSWLDKHKETPAEIQADRLRIWLTVGAVILGFFLIYLLIRMGIKYMTAHSVTSSVSGKLKASIESKLDWSGLTFSFSSASALASVALQRWFAYFSLIQSLGKLISRILFALVLCTGLYLFCLVKYPEPTHQVSEAVKKIFVKTN